MAVGLATDRPAALRQAIMCCRKGGTLSVPGVYIGAPDKVPFGALMNKALTVKTGQTHVQRYLKPLLERIENGEIDPSFVITHERPLSEGPELYKTFRDKQDGCIKVVLKPGTDAAAYAAELPIHTPEVISYDFIHRKHVAPGAWRSDRRENCSRPRLV